MPPLSSFGARGKEKAIPKSTKPVAVKYLLLLALALQYSIANGQTLNAGNAAPGLRLPADTAQAGTTFYHLPSLSAMPAGHIPEPSVRQRMLTAPPMPAAWSYEKLGAFCKWEVQMEKAARMPVKVRLGEVQYVERMEGKLPDYR